MSNERSDQIYWQWSESSEKFDYYVVGIAAAIFAFGVKNLNPQTLGVNPYTLRVCALLAILGSLVFGLRRIENTVRGRLLNYMETYRHEKIAALSGAPGRILRNQATGDFITPAQAEAEVEKAHMELSRVDSHFQIVKKSAISSIKGVTTYFSLDLRRYSCLRFGPDTSSNHNTNLLCKKVTTVTDDAVKHLFDGEGNWEHNARLTYSYDRIYLYMAGYREAATALVSHVLRSRFSLDTMFYPIAFLCRHYLELSLKCALGDAQDLLCFRRNVPNHHRLGQLWSMLRPLVLEIFAGDDREELKKLDRVIAAISQLDEISTTFRYPEDRAGQSSIPVELDLVNIQRFWEKFSEAADLMDGITCQIAEYLDYKREAEKQ